MAKESSNFIKIPDNIKQKIESGEIKKIKQEINNKKVLEKVEKNENRINEILGTINLVLNSLIGKDLTQDSQATLMEMLKTIPNQTLQQVLSLLENVFTLGMSAYLQFKQKKKW